jgi:hypothetical protein
VAEKGGNGRVGDNFGDEPDLRLKALARLADKTGTISVSGTTSTC